MTAAAVLDRLEGVRQTGAGRWIARCPAHGDKRPSLSVRELDDDRVLVHCFSGCSAEEILAAVGLDFAALFPEKPRNGLYVKNPRRLFSPMDVLRCIEFEAILVATAAGNIAQGVALSEADCERLRLAASRLLRAAEVARGE
jgi:hypothetical protein